MAAFKCLLSLLCLLAVTATSEVVEPTATTTGAMLMTTGSGSLDGAFLLQAEGLRLGELSKQVAETNRALEELLATKLRDIHYASVIGELRAEIDSLR